LLQVQQETQRYEECGTDADQDEKSIDHSAHGA
jgi:hypothetical protein